MNFNFATTGLSAGSNARIGYDTTSNAYKCSVDGQTFQGAPVLPPDTVGELAGIEVFPGIVNGVLEHADYIRPVIGGTPYDWQSLNELMAPGLYEGRPDPLGAAGLRHGIMPINFGLPLLMGGRPDGSDGVTAKIKPGQSIDVEIAAAPAAEGGLSTGLAKSWTIRFWVCQASGKENIKKTLQIQSAASGLGYYDGNRVDCSFDLGDFETMESVPLRTRLDGKQISNIITGAGGAAFDPLVDWGKLPGGTSQIGVKVWKTWAYAKQLKTTTANEYYQFVQGQGQVQDTWGQLLWDLSNFQKKALKITHLGLKQPAVGLVKYLNIKRSTRGLEQIYDVQPGKNPFQWPRYRSVDVKSYNGPSKLPKPITIQNENASIEIKDNGTAISPYSSTNNDSTMLMYGGILYDMMEMV